MINIKIDSRKVNVGDTFVAIKGHTVDGHKYINEAIKRGASKIIAEYDKHGRPCFVYPRRIYGQRKNTYGVFWETTR